MANLIEFHIHEFPHPDTGAPIREANAIFDLGDGKRTAIAGVIPPEMVSAREIAEWLLATMNAPWPTDRSELI